MHDLMVYITIACCVTFYLIANGMEKKHRKEIERIHESYASERKELLDRIMANNIQEFKSARAETEIKRSETGNFLKDRMEQQARAYVDLE